jgi:hypothetical protein
LPLYTRILLNKANQDQTIIIIEDQVKMIFEQSPELSTNSVYP